MTITMTYVDFVERVENMLGWVPKGKGTAYKLRSIEASRLKRKMDTNPALYTWENMLLALDWCRRNKYATTPTGVCWKVEQAVKQAADEKPLTETGAGIQAAISVEQGRRDSLSEYWITRLSRSSGQARDDVLLEWREAGRS